MPNTEFQPFIRFVQNSLVGKKITSCRKASKQFLRFKEELGLDPYKINFDEQDIISALQVAFEGEVIFTEYCIGNKKLDACLPKYKVGIEINKHDHEGIDPKYERSGQLMIERHGITVIRTNPEAANCINRPINQTCMLIIKCTKKQTKKSLIDDLSKTLLELEFKSNP